MDNSSKENGVSSLPQVPSEGLPEEGLLLVLLRNRWLIVSMASLTLAAAFIYLLKATPIFTSASRLCVEQRGPQIISEFEGVMTQSKNYLYTQAELIKSRSVVGTVADNPRIKALRMFNGVDNITGYIQGGLGITVGAKDDIITVSFDSPHPAEAALVVNEVISAYVDYHSTQKESIVAKVLDIIQKAKVESDKELDAKFKELLEFTRENGVVTFDNSGGHIVLIELAKLSDALTEARLSTINAKADYEAVKSMMDNPAKVRQFASALPSTGVRVFFNDIETQLRSELRDAELELIGLQYHTTEDHPAMQALHRRIDRIKSEIGTEAGEFAGSYVEVMRLRWLTAKQKQEELQTSLDAQRKGARELGIKAAEYAVLQSELKRAEEFSDTLSTRIRNLNVTEDTGALNVNIIEVARPAGGPSKPQKAKIMVVALVLGLMLGCGLAVARDWLDYRLRSADEISAVLGVPVLGVVPSMPKRQTVVTRGQKVHLDPKSTIAEAYRTIRTAVFFGVPKGEAKTILITSPAPGDGKSTLASNLAITMAQADQKTLILDADFRKPMQHNIFRLSNDKGLSNVLAGAMSLDEAVMSGPVAGLDVLVCGLDVPNPSEILNSEAFAGVLKDLSRKYDRIIIDSPPVSPVADSQILAAICDIVLLVLRAEKSMKNHSQQARDRLLSVGGRLLGAVVNDVPQKRGRYGYYSGYGHYGSYGHYGYYGKREKRES